MAGETQLFARPQTGPFTGALYRQVLDLVIEGKVFTLTVSTGENERIFFFTRGAILFLAVGTSGGEVLARKILARGLVPKEKLDPLVARANSDTPLLQDILKNEGVLEAAEVQKLVEEIVEEHLIEVGLFDGAGALYDLVPGNPPPRLYEKDVPALRLSLGTKPLLERARKTLQNEVPRLVALFLGSVRNKVKRAPGGGAGAPLAVLEHLQGEPRTIAEVLVAAQLAGGSALKAAQELAQLVSERRVQVEKIELRTKAEELVFAGKIENSFDAFVNHLLARAHLAQVYERAQEKERAAEQYRGIAEEHLARDGIKDGLDALRQVLRLLPTDVGARELLVKVLRGIGRTGEASREAVDLGKVLLELNLPGRARAAFDLALKMAPKTLSVLHMLAGLLKRLGDRSGAVGRYEEIAAIAAEAGDEKGMLAAYQEILDVDPKHEKALAFVRKLTGYRRAILARFSAAGAAVLALLLVLAWGTYEIAALSAYEIKRELAFEAVDQERFDVARSHMEEFRREWSLSRAARAADALVERIKVEERDVAELAALRAGRDAQRLEDAGSVPRALERWRVASATQDGARAAAARAAVLRCEQRLEKVNELLKEASHQEQKNNPRRAHELMAEAVAKGPWLLGQPDLRVPCLVDSVPQQAQVTVDGQPQDRPTPLVVRRPLAPGVLKVEARFREPVLREVGRVPSWPILVVLPRKPRWRLPEVTATGPALLARELVFVAGGDRAVTAAAVDAGRVVWRAPLGVFGECEASLAYLEPDLVLARTRSGTLVALDVASGAERWRVDLEPPGDLDPEAGRPVPLAGGVLVRSGARELVSLGSDAKPRWRAVAKADLVGAPLVTGELVVVAAERTLVAFRAKSGEAAWQARLSHPAVTGPVLGPQGRFYVALENAGLTFADAKGTLGHAEKELLEGGIAVLEGDPRHVFLGSPQGEVLALDERLKPGYRVSLVTGRPIRWLRSLGPDFLLAGDPGALYALDPQGNREWWRHPVIEGGPAVADENRVFQGSAEGLTALDR